VEQNDGRAVFASGSANPSRPAWLASATSGNVELLIARRGKDALSAAQSLGFNKITDMPGLNEADWQTIKDNAGKRLDPVPPGYRSGLAVIDDARLLFSLTLTEGLDGATFILCAEDGSEIARSDRMTTEGAYATIAFAPADLERAFALNGEIQGKLVLRLLLHHARAVEEQARTGTQRRFREALQSLETDTPNIALLIECIDKIIFSEDRVTVRASPRKEARPEKDAEPPEAPATLAIDIADIKKRTSKRRLSHSGDFAYLLDALIYHLRFEGGRTVEELDRFGRNEEEQVGADDDSDEDGEQPEAIWGFVMQRCAPSSTA
jgi:hypothetical protein